MSFAFLRLNSLLTNVQRLRDSRAFTGLIDAYRFLGDANTGNEFAPFIKQKHSQHLLAKPHSDTPKVPLSWVATTSKYPFANLGDALSPILVSALSGLPIAHQQFDSRRERLACVGTIGHGLSNGTIHFWGTGIDPRKNPVDRQLKHYKRPQNTEFQVHALRGPFSAQVLKNEGIDVPDVYGDPVWFLPSIIKPAQEKRYELGVIVHLSELTGLTDTANVHEHLVRYKIPESLAADVRIITTITKPTFAALEQRVQEITSCKRIISTSLHGLVIAEAYKIPCVYFRPVGRGAAFATLDNDRERVDQRMRDFYRGAGLEKLFVYGQRRTKETPWEKVISAIDDHWAPLLWSPERFLETFPLPLAFNPLETPYLEERSRLDRIRL